MNLLDLAKEWLTKHYVSERNETNALEQEVWAGHNEDINHYMAFLNNPSKYSSKKLQIKLIGLYLMRGLTEIRQDNEYCIDQSQLPKFEQRFEELRQKYLEVIRNLD